MCARFYSSLAERTSGARLFWCEYLTACGLKQEWANWKLFENKCAEKILGNRRGKGERARIKGFGAFIVFFYGVVQLQSTTIVRARVSKESTCSIWEESIVPTYLYARIHVLHTYMYLYRYFVIACIACCYFFSLQAKKRSWINNWPTRTKFAFVVFRLLLFTECCFPFIAFLLLWNSWTIHKQQGFWVFFSVAVIFIGLFTKNQKSG